MDVEQLRALLHYDPLTGIFTWKVRRKGYAGGVFPGDVAGLLDDRGYRRIGVLGKQHLAHRLAWFYVYGVWPPKGLDHRDRDHDHNALLNLRPCTQLENLQNTSLDGQGSNKFRGVYFSKERQKWRVKITAFKKDIYLGQFNTEAEAHAAYVAGKKKHHPFYEGAV